MYEHERGAALLAERTAVRLPAIVDDLMDRQWRDVPELWVTDDPALREAVLKSTTENAEFMLAAVQRPSAIPHALPPGPRLEADVTAQNGAHVTALLRTYRIGQQAFFEYFLDTVDDEEIPRAAAALRAATQTIHRYMESMVPLVADEHAAERERMAVDPDLRRWRLVEAALAGDASVDVGYALDEVHVAVVASGEHAAPRIERVAAALECDVLAVEAPDGRCWAWLATAAAEEARRRLEAAALGGPAGVAGPCPGPSGFRLAHRQARLAERVARAGRGRVVEARSAMLETMALGDQRTAWDLARAELGPLAGDEGRNGRLRETLEAWFAARESVALAATKLGVAPRTVSYRLRRAEELLGQPIAARRAELEAALRLRRLFEGEQPPPGV
jgi:hypothetical protein